MSHTTSNGDSKMRAARLRNGLTQRDAAIKVGCSFVHLCNVERRKADPSLRLLRAAARVYGVRIASLIEVMPVKSGDQSKGERDG